MTNSEFAKNDLWFKRICKDFCIKPTARQASKYRRKMGSAYKLANRLMN